MHAKSAWHYWKTFTFHLGMYVIIVLLKAYMIVSHLHIFTVVETWEIVVCLKIRLLTIRQKQLQFFSVIGAVESGHEL